VNFLTVVTSSFLWRKAAQTLAASVYTFAKNARRFHDYTHPLLYHPWLHLAGLWPKRSQVIRG
jgi:hypothetical protein